MVSSVNIRWNFFVKSIHSGKTKEKKIALTFDDGPHPEFTLRVLEILERHNAKATFFCIGKNVQNYPEIIKKIIENGHTIGNHSFSHSDFIDFNGKKTWLKEIEKTDSEIQQITGFKPKLFRPPFGVTTPHLADALRKSGHISVGWNIRTYDTILKSPEKIVQKVLKNVKPGSIVLLHDCHENIIPILENLLPGLARKNFSFVTVNELIDEKPYIEI
jgi:peptidoglycan/xylan/chitin deacetylase (PgdA/CDA1 family)